MTANRMGKSKHASTTKSASGRNTIARAKVMVEVITAHTTTKE